MAERQPDLVLEWDAENVAHIERHHIAPPEVEQVFRGDPLLKGYEAVDGEDRWTVVGATLSLRVLVLIFTMRGGRVRVVTGWEADKRTKKEYFEQKGG